MQLVLNATKSAGKRQLIASEPVTPYEVEDSTAAPQLAEKRTLFGSGVEELNLFTAEKPERSLAENRGDAPKPAQLDALKDGIAGDSQIREYRILAHNPTPDTPEEKARRIRVQAAEILRESAKKPGQQRARPLKPKSVEAQRRAAMRAMGMNPNL